MNAVHAYTVCLTIQSITTGVSCFTYVHSSSDLTITRNPRFRPNPRLMSLRTLITSRRPSASHTALVSILVCDMDASFEKDGLFAIAVSARSFRIRRYVPSILVNVVERRELYTGVVMFRVHQRV